MKTRELTKMSICVTLLCIASYISFPLPFTPAMITAQTIVINLIALILAPKQAIITVGVYILLGVCGIPVFTGGAAGLGKIFGPTGGFLIGYLLSAPIISLLKGRGNSFKRYLVVTVLVGMPIIYLGGSISMYIYQRTNILSILITAVFPFIFGDLLKCAAASYIGVKLNQSLVKSIEA